MSANGPNAQYTVGRITPRADGKRYWILLAAARTLIGAAFRYAAHHVPDPWPKTVTIEGHFQSSSGSYGYTAVIIINEKEQPPNDRRSHDRPH